MITFRNFLINEMPKALKDAALAGDRAMFKNELLSTFHKLKGQIENPTNAKYGVEGATNVKINQANRTHKWPYMTLEVPTDTGSKRVEIMVPNEEDPSEITGFQFLVDGQPASFQAVTTKGEKKVGDLAAGVSYILYGIHQALKGQQKSRRRREKAAMVLADLSDEELEAELRRRRESAPPDMG